MRVRLSRESKRQRNMPLDNRWRGRGGEKPDPAKCAARVSDHDSRWPTFYQCRSKPVRDGWCNMHHPDKLEAKAKARDDTYNRQEAYSGYLYERKERRNKIADAAIEGRFQDM